MVGMLLALLSLTGVATAAAQTVAPAQLQQVGSKLVGTGASGNAEQGYKLALSADGNTAIVGGVYDTMVGSSYVGAVWIFTRSNGVWSQQGDKLTGSDVSGEAEMGYSVAISGDGNTVAFGGHNDNGSLGAVWVFTRGNGVWSQQGNKIVGTGASGNANQGSSVALSEDGNTLAEGGVGDNSYSGAIWVFKRSADVWSQQGAKLVGSDASGGAEDGYEVSLSEDGNTLLDGAPHDNRSIGALRVFTRSSGTWSQQGDKLVPSDINPGDYDSFFGANIGLSGDGNTAVASAPHDNYFQGGFWIYTRGDGVWTQQGTKRNADLEAYNEGYGITISQDGATILDPEPYNGSNGGIWIFNNIGGTWVQQIAEVIGTGGQGGPEQGFWAALSSDGKTALVGGPNDNNAAGAVWAFDTETNFWSSPVGTPVTQTVAVVLPSTGYLTYGAISTQGAFSLDFTATGGSCQPEILYNQGDTCWVAMQFTPTAPGVRTGAIVLTSTHDDLSSAFSVYLKGTGIGSQTSFISGVIRTVAGNSDYGNSGNGAPAPSAEFNDPNGLAVDGFGNFYIADCGTGTVRQVNVSTGLISTFAGSTQGYGGDGGPATSAQLQCPVGMAVDGAGDLFIADAGDSVVREVNAATGLVSTAAGINGNGGDSGDGGPATSASIGYPNAVILDSNGNLYISDAQNCGIREVNALSGMISTVAGDGVCGYSGDGGPATSASLNVPLGMAMDSTGNLYIADNQANVIRVLNTHTGIINTFAGNGTMGYSGDGGPATSAELSNPRSVIVDPAGNVYITDTGNNTIRIVSASTGIITRFAGDGSIQAGYSGDGGAATSARLNRPDWPAIDANGNFYFVDETNLVVREINGAADLNFGAVPVNSLSKAQDFTLFNSGTGPLSLQSLAINGPFNMSGEDTSCSDSGSLSAGISCVVGVVFAPVASGNFNSSVTLGALAVNLNGTGGSPQVSTSTALNISPGPANAGQTVTFTATISPVPASPYGNVSFYSDCNLLGTASVNASGGATFTSNSLAATTYYVYAVYSGTTGSQGSISPSLTEVINASFTVSAPQTPFTIVSGGSVRVIVTVPPLGGAFNSPVTMSASGLPNGVIASFSPASVIPGNSGATTTMTIRMGNQGVTLPEFPLRRFPVLPLLAASLCGVLFLVARRSRTLRFTFATVALACLMVVVQGCNGGFSGTSQGDTYNVTVSGTSSAQQASTSITLVVQRGTTRR